MTDDRYLMESDDETKRLEVKTDGRQVQKQARWAGIRPGMRVGDFGCGPGKTSYFLNRLVQPGGSTIGIDISPQRINHARRHYSAPGLEFHQGNIRKPLDSFGRFDFIWVRFVLEHYNANSVEIIRNISAVLNPGGVLCLIDLDYNCLSHYGLSPRLEKALLEVMRRLEERAGFDPYSGRKLYAYLFDQGFLNIKVHLAPYHLIWGAIKEKDLYNWTRKVEVAAKNSGYDFREFKEGYEGFFKEFRGFFQDPRRFTYTPLICCHGIKPYNTE